MTYKIDWRLVPEDIIKEYNYLKKYELYWITNGGRHKDAYEIIDKIVKKRMEMMKPYYIEVKQKRI